jgi:Rieske Fe-S protein
VRVDPSSMTFVCPCAGGTYSARGGVLAVDRSAAGSDAD